MMTYRSIKLSQTGLVFGLWSEFIRRSVHTGSAVTTVATLVNTLHTQFLIELINCYLCEMLSEAGVVFLSDSVCLSVHSKTEQVGQLSQTNRAAAWVSFGKNVSEQSVHLTSSLLLLLLLQNLYSAQIQANSSQRRWCGKVGNMTSRGEKTDKF